jgi:hypothetical protein
MWLGINGLHILPQNIINHLHERGIIHLNQIIDEHQTTLWSQGWKDSHALDLGDHHTTSWNSYIRFLKLGHFKIKYQEDELV